MNNAEKLLQPLVYFEIFLIVWMVPILRHCVLPSLPSFVVIFSLFLGWWWWWKSWQNDGKLTKITKKAKVANINFFT